MKKGLLLLTIAGAMNAQTLVGLPDLKVDLQGNTDTTVLVNNSGRTIYGYSLDIQDDGAMPWSKPVYRMAGIPSGAVDVLSLSGGASGAVIVRKVHRDGTPVIISRISLDAVFFADGEHAGPDVARAYKYHAAAFAAAREFALSVLADISRIEALAQEQRTRRRPVSVAGLTGEQMMARGIQEQLVEELFDTQQKSGIEAARRAALHISEIPDLQRSTK